LGDGNLHFNISGADETVAIDAHAETMKRTVHDMVAARGGSFSAEHGIGQTKVGELTRYAPPLELELMRSIKKIFDPNGIMNPGKVLA
jgi:D-lactate dehydrogenase (cytochrome)